MFEVFCGLFVKAVLEKFLSDVSGFERFFSRVRSDQFEFILRSFRIYIFFNRAKNCFGTIVYVFYITTAP